MVIMASGLQIAPVLLQHKVSVDMKFQPSVGVLARKVDKLGADIRSFREPLKRIVREVMIPSIRSHFDSEGPGWASLAPNTVLRRGASGPILNRSGALRRTMGQMNVWHIDSEKAMITELPARVWYGGVHQAGSGGHDVQEDFAYPDGHHGAPVSLGMRNVGDEGSIPPRPFVTVDDDDIDQMERIMSEWVGERVRAAGLG